jgi:hypothetical protein
MTREAPWGSAPGEVAGVAQAASPPSVAPAATVTMAIAETTAKHENVKALRRSVCCKEVLGREDRKIAYSCRAGSRQAMSSGGNAMIRKILVASTALAAIAAFSVATEPVNARGSCVVLAAKGRGVEAKTSARSLKHLTNKINHYAHKNKLSSVRVGSRSTVCSKTGGLDVCKSSAKVCG